MKSPENFQKKIPKVWIINDYRTTIPGTRTLWHDLEDWLDGEFIGGPYNTLATLAEAHYHHATTEERPDVIIRNGSWFRPLDMQGCPQIGLYQDILGGFARDNQLKVMRDVVPVFNSEWTRAQFPEIAIDGTVKRLHATIPLPIDFDLFKPLPKRDDLRKKWGILPNSVCWVGARSEVKGWDILWSLISQTDFNWCLVMKDSPDDILPEQNVKIFSRVPHESLVEIYNACSVGLCTSRVETQHLAGLEMGACGLPLVTHGVGAYYHREDGRWGMKSGLAPALLASRLMDILEGTHDRGEIRAYWLLEGFDRESCRKAWVDLVEEVANGKRN